MNIMNKEQLNTLRRECADIGATVSWTMIARDTYRVVVDIEPAMELKDKARLEALLQTPYLKGKIV